MTLIMEPETPPAKTWAEDPFPAGRGIGTQLMWGVRRNWKADFGGKLLSKCSEYAHELEALANKTAYLNAAQASKMGAMIVERYHAREAAKFESSPFSPIELMVHATYLNTCRG